MENIHDKDKNSTNISVVSLNLPHDCNSTTLFENCGNLFGKYLGKHIQENFSTLNSARNQGRTIVHFAVSEFRNDILFYLIKYKYDLNIQDNIGWTPLILAVSLMNSSAVKFLLDAECDLNVSDFYGGNTALHIAVNKKNLDILKLLLKYDCDLYKMNSIGFNPLDLAIFNESCEITNILLPFYKKEKLSHKKLLQVVSTNKNSFILNLLFKKIPHFHEYYITHHDNNIIS